MDCLVKGANIEYQVYGTGRPVLILHRAMENHLEPIFNTNNDFRRIYVNYPGIGRSEICEWMISADDLLEVLIEFIDQIIGKEAFLIMGFSYSCYLARGILLKCFEQVGGIALLCPVIEPVFSKRTIPETRLAFRDDLFYSALKGNAASEIDMFAIQDENTYKQTLALNDSSITMNTDFFNKMKAEGKYSFSFDVDELTPVFTKPALILTGKNDYVVGYKDSLKLIDKYPRATFSILDMAGHGMQYEQKHMIDNLVIDWLNRVKRSECLVEINL